MKITILKRLIHVNLKRITFLIFNCMCLILLYLNSKQIQKVLKTKTKLDIITINIFKLLAHKDVFLADYDKLKEILTYKTSKHLDIYFQSFLKDNVVVSFGCLNENLDKLFSQKVKNF